MKKFVSLMLVFTLCAAMLTGCGSAGKQETSAPTETTQSAPAYDSALALMEAVWATYGESERIPAAGGDMEHDNMDGPGLFDIEKNAEMFQSLILVDETLLGMLENDAYCNDILIQSAAVNAAVNAFNRELLSNHIHNCVARDIRQGKDETIDELVTTLQKLMK